MKAVILAGGKGTRLGDDSVLKPKPLVEIGGKPILWHIMKIYAEQGVSDFVVCVGHKGGMIKEYFANFAMLNSDCRFDLASGEMSLLKPKGEKWTVTLVDTGEDSLTGTRLRKASEYLGDEPFFMTYGDGVGNIDMRSLLAAHQSSGGLATVTLSRPPARFGSVRLEAGKPVAFVEKPAGHSDDGWISAGFFVLTKAALERIPDEDCMWEHEPLSGIARDGLLGANFHEGFWHPMDTQRDRQHLEHLWATSAPWKIWRD